MKKYYLDIEWLNKKIKELQKSFKISDSDGDEIRAGIEYHQIDLLKEVKKQLKEL